MRQHAELVSHVAAELKSSRRGAFGSGLLDGLEIVFVEASRDVRPLVRIEVQIHPNPGAEHPFVVMPRLGVQQRGDYLDVEIAFFRNRGDRRLRWLVRVQHHIRDAVPHCHA